MPGFFSDQMPTRHSIKHIKLVDGVNVAEVDTELVSAVGISVDTTAIDARVGSTVGIGVGLTMCNLLGTDSAVLYTGVDLAVSAGTF
jgi:hypothetical protein